MSHDDKCSTILPYIPTHVREYLRNYESNVLKPKSIDCFGVAMMVDVSGYSKLASNLAQKGSIGPELLSNSMNGYLDKMIKIILQYKGDLVKFAGDAVIICWTIENINKYQYIMQEEYEEMKLALLLNATRCSLQMLTELSKYTVEIDDLKIDLNIHIGLGVGIMFNVHVGGYPGRWEHFISGSAVNQVTKILDLAKAGQIAVSIQFYRQLVKLFNTNNLDITSHSKGAIILEATVKNIKQIFFQKLVFNKLPNILGIINTKNDSIIIPPLDKEKAFINNISQSVYSNQTEDIKMNILKLMKHESEYTDLITGINKLIKNIYEERNEEYQKTNNDNITEIVCENYAEKSSEEVYNLCKEYINEGALSKIESGTKNLIKFSELRRITTLFLKVNNIKFEESNDLSLAQESLDAVQRALVLQEGILRQFLIDDKGAIILIYFGLPPLSHENDAQVGIEAALEICKNMKRVNDNFTIGVGTGITWVGGIGNEDRADYSVVGDSVNMAARLMMKAEKNTILCDEETYKLTKDNISYKYKGTLIVKGKSKSIMAYQPVNCTAVPIHLPKITTEIELIGREKEIEVIESILVNYSTKCEGISLLVQGVEGLGLMPLAEFLIKEAKKNNINVCTSVAKKLERTTIYSAYKPIIIEIINICLLIQKKKPLDSFLYNNIERAQNDIGKYHSTDSIRSSKDDIQDKLSPRSNRFSISSRVKPNVNFQDNDSISCSFDSVDTEHNNFKEKRLFIFKSAIIETLNYLGENPELVSLFSLMFPYLITGNISEDENENKISEFSYLLVRLVTKLTIKTPLIIVIDQLQYLDPISLKLTELLHKSQAKMILGLFTCPESHYSSREKGLETLKSISKSKRTVNIVLGSVSEDATCEIIKDLCTIKFQKKCTGVSESILKVIFERTQGTPIYIRRMTTWMLELSNFILSEDGSLTIIQKDDNPIDIESIVPSGDIEAIVVAQFDKLDSNYQEFLKVASVVGQFKVTDIKNYISKYYKKNYNFLKSEEEIDSNDYERPDILFKTLDKYGFLKIIYQDSDFWLDSTYAFSSDMIQKAIYTLNTFSKREEIHLYFAHFYEQEYLSNQDRQDLLVSIYEHYSHSPDKQKTKIYLEKVCRYYYKLKSMQEAIKYYKLLFKSFRYDQNSSSMSSVSNWTLSEWHKQIGEAYLAIQRYKEAESHIIVSLKLLGVQIPSGGFNLWWFLRVINRKNDWLYQNNFNTKPCKNLEKEKKFKVIRGCLLLLSEIYNYLHKQALFKLCIKMALKWSVDLKMDIKYFLILSMYSIELIANAVEGKSFLIGITVLKKVKYHLIDYDNTLSYDCLLIHDSLAQCYFILGDWKNSLKHWDILINKASKLNEIALWDKGVIMKSFTEFHSGNTDICLKTTTEMLKKRKSWKNQCLAYGSIFMDFILQNEEEDMTPILSMMKKLTELADKRNLTNYSIQIVFYGLMGQVYYRFGVSIIDNIYEGLMKIVKYLDKLGHQSWGALISFPHLVDMLYSAYDKDVFLTNTKERTLCLGILFTLINALEKYFSSYLICVPVIALTRGLMFLISGEYEEAIKTWNTGLIDKDETRISNIHFPYFTGIIYSLIKKYSLDPDEKSNALKMVNGIESLFSYDFGEIEDVSLQERYTCVVIDDNLKNSVYSDILNKNCVETKNKTINYLTQQQNVLSLDMRSNLMNENIHRGIPERSNATNLLYITQKNKFNNNGLITTS
ncbi:hypothetical protein BCR32DRAFT_294366 [Anaeromyces robustus]|uniref:Guanylate cyclase domain-containing protein n=1 Tax=Anaeromyces robustus TaxID=1754192 RepID=A0A1Y1X1J8_9FUNG|nr:hypothetical protein BCR32DRAFT_294366 [Anaeromyces robustus]|eukprot:ORX79562.1 hypothetical protein BCR32DRAFT_294366 [Anaeromyces robustus]